MQSITDVPYFSLIWKAVFIINLCKVQSPSHNKFAVFISCSVIATVLLPKHTWVKQLFVIINLQTSHCLYVKNSILSSKLLVLRVRKTFYGTIFIKHDSCMNVLIYYLFQSTILTYYVYTLMGDIIGYLDMWSALSTCHQMQIGL
jgi:hypothetical protein